jgi:putative ABC transport system substrate-binding protein
MHSHDNRIIARRAVLSLLGGAAAAPLAWQNPGRTQQAVMPVVGFLDSRSPDAMVDRLRAFHLGLKEAGFVEGENVTIIYRWGEGRYDRLSELAGDLVRRQVAVIASGGGVAPALAAKAATTTIPIVFAVPQDPASIGLVASVARPGGNLTGTNFFTTELAAKRLELLRELVPGVARVAVLVNPANPNADPTLQDVGAAARSMGLQIQAFNASTSREIDAAFADLMRARSDAVFVGGDALFLSRRVPLVNLTVRHGIPASFSQREYAELGGLMSYGSKIADAYRQVGIYTGRILKGAKPADLPVVQSAKFELVINHQTARMFGLTVPPSLLSVADEVIE